MRKNKSFIYYTRKVKLITLKIIKMFKKIAKFFGLDTAKNVVKYKDVYCQTPGGLPNIDDADVDVSSEINLEINYHE